MLVSVFYIGALNDDKGDKDASVGSCKIYCKSMFGAG